MRPDDFVALLGRARASAILRTDAEEAAAPAMEAALRAGFEVVDARRGTVRWAGTTFGWWLTDTFWSLATTPGGYILVTRGLYELLASDSEVAAVLAHEISHAVERDHYEVIRKQELTTAGKDVVAGEVAVGAGVAENYAKQYVEKHGATILVTSLDRQAEFRSDKAAEIYLARAGMNPMALYAVLQKMMALGAQSASLAALYKTHPPLDARLDRIDERGYEKLQAYVTRE